MTLCYSAIAEALNHSHPVYCIQSPQIAGIQLYPLDLTTVCRAYVSEILKLQLRGPYCLAGWSLGGILAFEITRILEHQGHCVQWVALFDALWGSNASFAQENVKDALIHFRESPTPEDFLSLILKLSDERIDSLFGPGVASVIKTSHSDKFVKHAFLEFYYSMKMAAQLMEEFIPMKLQAPIHAFWAEESAGGNFDTKAWQVLSANARSSSIHTLPGNHHNFLSGANAQLIASTLNTIWEAESPQ